MSLYESPLTLIEETAHGSCRSTTAPEGAYTCLRLSLHGCVCVKVRHAELQTSQNQYLATLASVVFFSFGVGFFVIWSHHSAFSRWFPAGLRMTCDNITVLKGQA